MYLRFMGVSIVAGKTPSTDAPSGRESLQQKRERRNDTMSEWRLANRYDALQLQYSSQ